MAIYINGVDMPTNCTDCRYRPYACLHCVNYTCTREPNEGTVEAEISGKRDRACEFDDAMSQIDSVPSAEAEWIPCSERLPDAEYGEGDSMLCCTESGLMYILYWNGGNWCASTGEPYHWVNHKTGWHDKVIAWMPLPKPWKGADDE